MAWEARQGGARDRSAGASARTRRTASVPPSAGRSLGESRGSWGCPWGLLGEGASRQTKLRSWSNSAASLGTAAQLLASSWNLSSGFHTPPKRPWQSVTRVFLLYNSFFTSWYEAMLPPSLLLPGGWGGAGCAGGKGGAGSRLGEGQAEGVKLWNTSVSCVAQVGEAVGQWDCWELGLGSQVSSVPGSLF